jgi:tetratricopeptide (TPR) repeat protein
MDEAPTLEVQPEQQPARIVKCARCGVTSTLPEVFQLGRIAQNKSGLLCPRCFQERQSSYGQWLLEAMFLIVLLGGGFLMAGNLAPVGVIMLSLACGFFFTVILTPLHELAHALTAMALGLPVYAIQIGWFGKSVLKFHLGRCSIDVTRIPLGGLTYVASPSAKFIRTKHFLVTASAPILHLALAIFAWMIIDNGALFDWMPGWAAWLVIVFGLANVFELVLNLWPRRYHSAIGNLPNDGLTLLTLPFVTQAEIDGYPRQYFHYECAAMLRLGDHTGAIACCMQGLERFPGDETLRYCQALVLLDQHMLDEARRLFEELRQQWPTASEFNAILLNNIAWTDLLSWNQEELGRACAFSRQAIEALPWESYIKGTRGSALVASGEVERGMILLRQAIADNEDLHNKAYNAAFMALGCARLGRVNEARDFLRQAEQLDLRCCILAHIRRELDVQVPGIESIGMTGK